MKRYKLKKDTPAFKAGTECYIEEAGHMVPCRGISYTIVHKYQLEKNPNILAEWFEEIDESNRWKPEMHQVYRYINTDSYVSGSTWTDDYFDDGRFKIGNCFQTKEEAKRVVEYLKSLSVVRGDATSKFTRDRNNFYVYYDIISNHLAVGVSFYDLENGIFGLPYFATTGDARRSIELHRHEWLTIFGVKEENEAQK